MANLYILLHSSAYVCYKYNYIKDEIYTYFVYRTLAYLAFVLNIPKNSASVCHSVTNTEYIRGSMKFKIIWTCGEDEKVVLPMEPYTEKLPFEEISATLILKQIVGTSVPPAAFEMYNTTTALYLNDLGIEQISPGAFQSLNNMEELHLKGNKLENILSGVFNINNLKIINLSFNKFSSMNQVSLEGTYQIQSVNMSSNSLTNIEINETWNNISILDLTSNAISHVDKLPINLSVLNISKNALTSFSVSQNLIELDLRSNLLKTFDFNLINTTMNKLNLQNNQVSVLFGNYCSIKDINLSHNNLNSVPCDCSNISSKVESLNLAGNVISYLMPQTISELHNLIKLNLESNQIKIIKTGTFVSLQKLLYLNLSHNAIQSFEIGSIDNIKNLEEIDISYNQLTQINRYVMHSFTSLKHLHLEYNNITFINATNLNVHLPVIWDINIIGNNLSCNNLWELIRIFNKRPVYFTPGSFKNVSNVHGIACYLQENSNEENFATSLNELEVSKTLTDYFNHDYRESNYYKFLEELDYSNTLVFNESHKLKQAIDQMLHSFKTREHLRASTNTSVNGYLIVIVLFLLSITCFIVLQAYVLYNKFRTGPNLDSEELL